VKGIIPSHAYFLALPTEADGFISPCVNALLHGFAKTRADRDQADICALRAWHEHGMDAVAHTHARGLARVLISRASANLMDINGSNRKRWRARPLYQSDAEASRPSVSPDPPGANRRPAKRRCGTLGSA